MKKENPPYTLAMVGCREVFPQTYRSDRLTVRWSMYVHTFLIVQLEIEKLYFHIIRLYSTMRIT